MFATYVLLAPYCWNLLKIKLQPQLLDLSSVLSDCKRLTTQGFEEVLALRAATRLGAEPVAYTQ